MVTRETTTYDGELYCVQLAQCLTQGHLVDPKTVQAFYERGPEFGSLL